MIGELFETIKEQVTQRLKEKNEQKYMKFEDKRTNRNQENRRKHKTKENTEQDLVCKDMCEICGDMPGYAPYACDML